MAAEGPTRVPILGQDTIIVDHGLWKRYVAQDLLQSVKSSTYVLITDTNIGSTYVPSFERSFNEQTKQIPSPPRLLLYQISPGETSKSRSTKDGVEDWLLSHGCTRDTVIIALGGG